MAVVDIIVLSIIILSCLFGLLRGLVKEALSLVYWILAAVLATLYSPQAGEILTVVSDSPTVRRMAAFALIFIITVFAGALVSNLVSKMTAAVGLKGTDRALGALFGVIRGIIIVTLLVMLTSQFEFTRQWYNDSLSMPYITVLADYFRQLLGMSPETVTV